MIEAADYVVAYDVTSDKERARVDKVLKGFGFRVQKSVFECRMRRSDLERLKEKLKELNLKTGFTTTWRLEHNGGKVTIGDPIPEDFDGNSAYVI